MRIVTERERSGAVRAKGLRTREKSERASSNKANWEPFKTEARGASTTEKRRRRAAEGT